MGSIFRIYWIFKNPIKKLHIQSNFIFCGKKSGRIYNIVTSLILGGGVICDNLDILFLLTYFID